MNALEEVSLEEVSGLHGLTGASALILSSFRFSASLVVEDNVSPTSLRSTTLTSNIDSDISLMIPDMLDPFDFRLERKFLYIGVQVCFES